jgi:hypothetical protein
MGEGEGEIPMFISGDKNVNKHASHPLRLSTTKMANDRIDRQVLRHLKYFTSNSGQQYIEFSRNFFDK